jgi:two-component system, NarL family, nitrate/nitrite response regulator NarL
MLGPGVLALGGGAARGPLGLAPRRHQTGAAMSLPDSRRNPGAAKPAGKRHRPIRLLLVDDHPVVREGLGLCLATHPNLEIVGQASDGDDALRKARDLLPDIILMDIEMPHMNGLAVTELLREELPQIKVLILSMHSSAEYVLRIVQSGARGYLFKAASLEELVKAIETVNAGEMFFSSDVARVALKQLVRQGREGPELPPLSKREREVCTRIAEGLSNKEIAQILGVGLRSVETHRERLMRKLNIHTVAGLTKFAVAKGLMILDERKSLCSL